MSETTTAADQTPVAAFDAAVAAFKVALGGDDRDLIRASAAVSGAMLGCRVRAAAIRAARRHGERDEEDSR